MANQTATDFGLYPPRTVHVGVNRMHTSLVAGATVSSSASDNYYMFQIPNECMVVGGRIRGSVPSGTIGNTILQVGIPSNETLFGTYTLSGTAVLSTTAMIFAPVTVSSSGTDTPLPVVIAVLSSTTSTASISVYLLLEYVMPGNIN